jgi:hypothetical protein
MPKSKQNQGHAAAGHPKSALWIHGKNSVQKRVKRDNLRVTSNKAWHNLLSSSGEQCFNQDPGQLTKSLDPTTKTDTKSTWRLQYIIDPVPVECDSAKLNKKPATQLKIKDAWADGGVSRLAYNSPIYACVGNGKEGGVPTGHIISGLSSFTASGADALQCSLNGGKPQARKISLRRK